MMAFSTASQPTAPLTGPTVWLVVAEHPDSHIRPLSKILSTDDIQFVGWVVGVYSSKEKAEKQILEGHQGCAKYAENIYIHGCITNESAGDAAVLKIFEYALDDTNE